MNILLMIATFRLGHFFIPKNSKICNAVCFGNHCVCLPVADLRFSGNPVCVQCWQKKPHHFFLFGIFGQKLNISMNLDVFNQNQVYLKIAFCLFVEKNLDVLKSDFYIQV